MIINHNLGSMNAQRNMGINSTNASKSMEKLSSGLRINRAGDDAAGLAISEKMRGQIRGLDQASSNAQNAISLIGTGEGALNETHSILQRMRELAVQSSSDTNVGTDREQIQSEVDQLAKEISRISNDTEFNQKNLLGGNLNDIYQVGANKDQSISLAVNAMDAKSLGVSGDTTVTTATLLGANVATATFGTTVGAGVVDGAALAFTYNVATTGSVATAGTLTGTATIGTALLGDAGDFVFSVDGGANKTATIATDDTLATVITKINTAAGATIASDDGTGKLKLTSTSTGAGSSITEAGTSTAATLTYLGITSGQTNSGADAVAATAANVTVSDGTTAQVVDITDPAATSFAVTTGNYSGVSITTSGVLTLTDLAGGVADTVTVAQTVTASTAATFAADGTMTKAAVVAGINVSSQTSANNAIKTINDAIETVSTERSKLGAYTNRLEHTIANLGTSSENLTSAESRIRDVDMAKEMSTFSKNNILAQAAQAMLAQANQQPQQVLQLLR